MFLRKIRLYPNKGFYYFVIFSNLILRLAFILTISTNYFLWIDPGLLISITSLLEIYRRAQWNFLRVELEHIRLLKNFEPINGFVLPYKFDLDFKNNQEEREFMKKIVNNILLVKKTNQELLIQKDGPNLYYQIELYKTKKLQKESILKENQSFRKLNYVGK